MKYRFITLLFLVFALNVSAQINPPKFDIGLRLTNAIQRTAVDSLPYIDGKGDINGYVLVSDLLSGVSGSDNNIQNTEIDASTYTFPEPDVEASKQFRVAPTQTDVMCTVGEMNNLTSDTNYITVQNLGSGTLTLQAGANVTLPTITTDSNQAVTIVSYIANVWQIFRVESVFETPTLQQVLNAGPVATSPDGNSSLSLSIDNSPTIDFENYDGSDLYTRIRSSNSATYLRTYSFALDTGGELFTNANGPIIKRVKPSNFAATEIKINAVNHTGLTSFNFPDLTSGNYTVPINFTDGTNIFSANTDGLVDLSGISGGGNTDIIIPNTSPDNTVVDNYSIETLSGNLLFKANGGTNGNAAPFMAISANDLLVQYPLASNTAIDNGSGDIGTTKDWQIREFDKKQNALTAGTNITIVGDVISASGGGSSTALATTYDNTNSALVATNVMAALDELDSKKLTKGTDPDAIQMVDGSTTSLSAINPNAVVTPVGQIYVNNFDNLTGLAITSTGGSVTVASPIGSTLPNTPNALTMEHTVSTTNYAVIDLGQVYTKLYVQFYACVVNQAGATSYTDHFQIGASPNASYASRIRLNHSAPDYRFYGEPNFLFIGARRPREGVWKKISIELDAVAGTAKYSMDGRLSNTSTILANDMQYITLGGTGDGVDGYKVQYTGLTVNETAFQDAFEDTTGVGSYQSHYVDASYTDSVLDMSTWNGDHKEPYDPEGGTNYTNGPAIYLSDVSLATISKPFDRFYLKRGEVYKMKTLSTPHQLNVGSGVYSADTFMALGAYGTGDLPKLDTSIIADDAAWTVHDAGNFIYKQNIANIANLYGVWIDESKGLNITQTYADLETTAGQAYEDGTTLFVRLYDDGNPASHVIDVASNQNVLIRPYSVVSDIHFRYGLVVTEDYAVIENSEATQGTTLSAGNYAHIRNNKIYDQWGGKDYVSNSEGSGGAYGILAKTNSAVYLNTVEGCYVGIETSHSETNVLIAFNFVKNSVVSDIECGGNVGGGSTIANPIRIIGNTVLHAPATTQDLYPITGDQPGHGIVVQPGTTGSAYYQVLNNIVLTHFKENLGQNGTPNCIALENAIWSGEVDYNRYFITTQSGVLPKYFGTGDDFAVWKSTLTTNGWTGHAGNAIPDQNSYIVDVMPIIQANATPTSGKFLESIPQPTSVGGGFPFDFTSWGITVNKSGEVISTYRNIGAY